MTSIGTSIATQHRQGAGFNPASIKSAELQQFLFGKTAISSGSIIPDERTNKGDARPVQLGRCYNFDGVDDFVQTNIPSNVNGLAGSFSFFTYVNPTANSSSGSFANHRIFNFTNGTSARVIFGLGGKVRVTLWTGSLTTRESVATIPQNQVSSIGATFLGTTLKIYINGALDSTHTDINYITDTTADHMIIGRGGTATAYYQGRLWAMQIFASALSDQQMADLHAYKDIGNGRICYFKADEQAGTTAYSSVNGYTGVITNATLGTFHSTQDIYSWQNEVGYSKPATVFIPRNESIPTQDVLGNPLEFSGSVPYNGLLKQSNCVLLDGTDDLITMDSAVDTQFNFTPSQVWEIEQLVRPDLSQQGYVWSKNTAAGGLSLLMQTSGSLRLATATGGPIASSDAVFTTNVWQWLKVTYDGADNVTFFRRLANETSYTQLNTVSSVTWTSLATTPMIFGNRTGGSGATIYKGEIAHFNMKLDGATVFNLNFSIGTGVTVYDTVSSYIGTLINAPTWSKQDVYHSNFTDGCSPYVYLNSVNSYVNLNGMANELMSTGVYDMSFSCRFDNNNTVQRILWFIGSGLAFFGLQKSIIGGADLWVRNSDGNNIVRRNIEGLTPLTTYELRLVGDGVNSYIYVNGVLTHTDAFNTANFETPTWTITTIGADIVSTPTLIWDWKINTATYAQDLPMRELSGTTLVDISESGNDGTIVNSYERAYIPAQSDTLDVFDEPLRNPYVAGAHNGAETLIDFTGGVASPAAVQGAWEDDWAFNTARTNPKFKRTLTLDGVDHRMDRALAYSAALSGTDLTKVQKYTETKAL